MKAAAAVLIGAILMLWPALVNHYPIVFSDTAGLAEMGLAPTIGWDKPWVYGPLIFLLDADVSLWGAAIGQALALSLMLWIVARVAGVAGAIRHVLLCALLAVGSAAPWFASLVMPDIFAPLTVLCLFVLAWGRGVLPRAALAFTWIVASIAIGAHLAHLIIAAACLVVILLLRPRRLLICATPLAAALAWIMASNLVGNGIVAVSPYGSVFALARMQADGTAANYLHAACPTLQNHFCAWSSHLPMDSDAFMWEPEGPIWGGGSGPTRVAADAAAIVKATIAFEPLQVAQAAFTNTMRQLGRVQVGDVLGSNYLDITVGALLRLYFSTAEAARLAASLQSHDELRQWASPLAPLRLGLLILGAAGSVIVVPMAWRDLPAVAALALLALVGVLANAFATGALSGPHDRYGARIAWIVLLAPLLILLRGRYSRSVASEAM